MSDAAALLRAISLHPEDDTPRLMFADEITESDPARAELIRVQIELAKFGPRPPSCDRTGSIIGRGCPGCLPEITWQDDTGSLRDREAELLRQHEIEWRRPKCPTCQGGGKKPKQFKSGSKLDYGKSEFGRYSSRETWGHDKCPTCRGTGACGPLSEIVTPDPHRSNPRPRWTHDVTWVRGFPVVKCRLEEVWHEVLDHTNNWDTWRPTPWAVECVRIGASFEIDLEPFSVNDTRGWCSDRIVKGRAGLIPHVVWESLRPTVQMNLDYYKAFINALDAHLALNAAVHRLVVRAAYPE